MFSLLVYFQFGKRDEKITVNPMLFIQEKSSN
jgi:hypothetical protein